jgi:hypothetical protein
MKNPDGFPSCSLSGIWMGFIQGLASPRDDYEWGENKVMAGETPANPARQLRHLECKKWAITV